MRLTRAIPADAKQLAQIMAGWIKETPWMPQLHEPEEDIRFLKYLIREQQVTTLRDWRGVHGFLAHDCGNIHALYIAPKARNRGCGVALLNEAKSAAEDLMLWSFQANIRARAFYAREGFVEVELTDGSTNDEQLPDVRMRFARGLRG